MLLGLLGTFISVSNVPGLYNEKLCICFVLSGEIYKYIYSIYSGNMALVEE